MEETSLSKTVAALSSEKSEIKRLLQSLQPVGSVILAAITLPNVVVQTHS